MCWLCMHLSDRIYSYGLGAAVLQQAEFFKLILRRAQHCARYEAALLKSTSQWIAIKGSDCPITLQELNQNPIPCLRQLANAMLVRVVFPRCVCICVFVCVCVCVCVPVCVCSVFELSAALMT